MRLSGGDLLKWCRDFGGKRIRDLQDVPRPLLHDWFIKLEAFQRANDYKTSILTGMLDDKQQQAANENRQKVLHSAGFLDPWDVEMQHFWQNYLKSKPRLLQFDDVEIPAANGQVHTGKSGRLYTLRRAIKDCIARVTGVQGG